MKCKWLNGEYCTYYDGKVICKVKKREDCEMPKQIDMSETSLPQQLPTPSRRKREKT